MPRIAYVDHSYHRRTRSTMFIPEMLARRGHQVDVYWDEAWTGGAPIVWDDVASHDVIVMFQSQCEIDAGRSYGALHDNVVYIPMFDQFGFGLDAAQALLSFWEPFQGAKVLSFSTAVHVLASSFGVASWPVHYYPTVSSALGPPAEGLHGFLWLRRDALGWDLARTLIGGTRFDSFHLHVVGDPGFPPAELPSPADLEAHNVTVSSEWFERRSDFERVVRRANVYFAPRRAEGIGQSFLEAMARGQCVVAVDNPTMNEYVVHGVNGLLYDVRAPQPVDFSEVNRLGRAARRGIIAGRRRWEDLEDSIVDFILTPNQVAYDLNRPAIAFGVSDTQQAKRLTGSIAHAGRWMSVRAAGGRRFFKRKRRGTSSGAGRPSLDPQDGTNRGDG